MRELQNVSVNGRLRLGLCQRIWFTTVNEKLTYGLYKVGEEKNRDVGEDGEVLKGNTGFEGTFGCRISKD